MTESATPSAPQLQAVDADKPPDAPPPDDGVVDLVRVAGALLRDLIDTASLEFAAARLAVLRLLALGAVTVVLAVAALLAGAGALALLLHTLGLNLALAMALTALLLAGVCALLALRMARYAKLLSFPAFKTLVRETLGDPDD